MTELLPLEEHTRARYPEALGRHPITRAVVFPPGTYVPGVIVAEEKHATRYLDATTPEAFAKNALKLLTERLQNGYTYQAPEAVFRGFGVVYERQADGEWGYSPGPPVLTTEQIEALPEHLQKGELGRQRGLADYERDLAYYMIWWTELHEIVETQDTEVQWIRRGRYCTTRAWDILQDRSEHQYERVAREDFER